MKRFIVGLVFVAALGACTTEPSASEHIAGVEAILEECRGLRDVKAGFEDIGNETADYYANITAVKMRGLGCPS